MDWYEWIRITGYWFLDDPDDSANKKWSPPEGLIEFMDKAKKDNKKIVYIGFGSIGEFLSFSINRRCWSDLELCSSSQSSTTRRP